MTSDTIFVAKQLLFHSPWRPQTLVYNFCWRACSAKDLRSSWVCWRPAPAVSTPSAPPAATPAPGAARPSTRCPWRSSAATPTATLCYSSPAVSPLNVWSFVSTAVRSAIAVKSCQKLWHFYIISSFWMEMCRSTEAKFEPKLPVRTLKHCWASLICSALTSRCSRLCNGDLSGLLSLCSSRFWHLFRSISPTINPAFTKNITELSFVVFSRDVLLLIWDMSDHKQGRNMSMKILRSW